MYTALYYPHISITDKKLIKNALLLWDKLEYITPNKYNTARHDCEYYNQALSIITEPHVPSKEEKQIAHEAILELATSDLPSWFYFNSQKPWDYYNIYPQKLLTDTWDALMELKLVNKYDHTFVTSPSFGFSLMSILADSCAGKQRQMITDEIDFYSSLMRYLTEINGGEYGIDSNDLDRLVTISIKTINLNKINIKSLVSYRRREKEGDANLRKLRHNYLKKIMEYTAKLAKDSKTKKDKDEIERQFEQDMKDDLNYLCEELKIEAKNVVFSKEMAVAIIATAGTIIEPITSTIIATGALNKKRVEYKASRKKILEQHPIAWLHESKRFKIY